MAFPLLKDFNEGVVRLMTEGFRSGLDLTLMKYPSEEGGAGPHVLSVARDSASGALGGYAVTSVPLPRGAKLQATLTPDLMVGSKVSVPLAAGLGLEVDSALGAHGVYPLGGLDVQCRRDAFTAHASASPGSGLLASLTTGGGAVACGGAAMFAPNGKYGGAMLGASLGGALSAQLTVPAEFSGMPGEAQVSLVAPLSPRTVLALVVEKTLHCYGKGALLGPTSGALCVGYQFPTLGVFSKALCVAGPNSDGGRFATGKFCVQAGLPVGQVSASAEVPLFNSSPTASHEAPTFGLSLSLGM